MIKKDVFSVLIIVILLIQLTACASPAQTQELTWEYLSIALHCQMIPPDKYVCTELKDGWDQVPFDQMKSLGDYLSEHGKNRWELVSVFKEEGDILLPSTVTLVLKRPELK